MGLLGALGQGGAGGAGAAGAGAPGAGTAGALGASGGLRGLMQNLMGTGQGPAFDLFGAGGPGQAPALAPMPIMQPPQGFGVDPGLQQLGRMPLIIPPSRRFAQVGMPPMFGSGRH